MDQARKLGIEVIGHAVRSVNIEGALQFRQHVAHMEEFIYGYFRQGITSAELPQDPESARRRLTAMLDSSKIPPLAERTAESGIYVVPNLVAYHYILRQVEDLDRVLDRPEVRLVYPAFRSFWGPANNRYTTRPNLPRFQAVLEVSFPFLQELTRAFQQSGVPLLMGSDALIPGGGTEQLPGPAGCHAPSGRVSGPSG